MSNSKSVIISFGQGDFQTGFPQIGIEVWEGGSQRMKSRSSLPPAPNLPDLYRRWQIFYEDYHEGLGWRSPVHFDEDEIEINENDITNISEVGFIEVRDLLRQQLNDWLDSKEFRDVINRKVRTCLGSEEIQVRIETEDEQLRRLPWCVWHFFEDYGKAEPELSNPVYNRIQSTNYEVEVGEKLVKVLAIIGNSDGINIKPDRRTIEKLPGGEVTFLTTPKLEDLNDKLWEEGWDILFFAGHSSSKDGTGRIYINDKDSLTIEELKPALNKAIALGLQLAIFNSCDGLKLASDLADLQIPAVIVMREPVPDIVAQKWLEYFLKCFSDGKSLHYSIRQARERLQRKELPCADWLPTLCRNPAESPPSWGKMRTGGRIGGDRWVELNLQLSKNRTSSKKITIRQVLGISLAVSSLVIGVRYLGILEPLELSAYDHLLRMRPVEKIDDRLLLVKITDKDIKNLGGEYPLSDRTVLKLLKKLNEHQPAVIGLHIYRDRPEREGRANLIKYLQQLKGQVIPICANRFDDHPAILPPPGIPDSRLGFDDVISDSDRVTRRHLLSMTPVDSRKSIKSHSSCPAYSSLSFQLVYRYLVNTKGLSPHEDFVGYKFNNTILKYLKVYEGFYNETNIAGGQILLNYRSTTANSIAERVTLSEILKDEINSQAIKDKIIIISTTDPTVSKKVFITPYNHEISGLELQAQMVSQIISAVEENRPLLVFLPSWSDAILIIVCAIVGGVISWRFSLKLGSGLVSVAVVTLAAVSYIILLNQGLVLPFVPSALALVGTSSIATKYKQ